MSKPRVVIRAFTLRRDIATALLLARQLEQRGCAVIVASGRDFVRTLRFWKPDVAVINTVGQIRRCADLAPGAAIVMLPGEGANARKHCDAVHLAEAPETYEKVDRFLLWGKATDGYFRELLPDADHGRLAVCGNPRLDLAKFNPELLRVPAAQKTVGFIGRYHILNRYNAVPAIFSMQRPEKREGVLWQVENFFCTITLIRRLIEETDYRISLRPHPLEAPEGYAFMNEGFFAGRVEIDESLDVAPQRKVEHLSRAGPVGQLPPLVHERQVVAARGSHRARALAYNREQSLPSIAPRWMWTVQSCSIRIRLSSVQSPR